MNCFFFWCLPSSDSLGDLRVLEDEELLPFPEEEVTDWLTGPGDAGSPDSWTCSCNRPCCDSAEVSELASVDASEALVVVVVGVEPAVRRWEMNDPGGLRAPKFSPEMAVEYSPSAQ